MMMTLDISGSRLLYNYGSGAQAGMMFLAAEKAKMMQMSVLHNKVEVKYSTTYYYFTTFY